VGLGLVDQAHVQELHHALTIAPADDAAGWKPLPWAAAGALA
jgi:hypothetical protein